MSKRSRRAARRHKKVKREQLTEAGARNSKSDLDSIRNAIRSMFKTLTKEQQGEMAKELSKGLRGFRVVPKGESK